MMNAKLNQQMFSPFPVIRTAHQDNSNDTPQPIGECHVSFPLLWIRINQDKPLSTVKGSELDTHIQVVGYHFKRLDEPVFMAVSKPIQTEFGIHHRLESCVPNLQDCLCLG